MQVLIADDDRDILSTLADQLELQGIEADFAWHGRQAVSLVAANTYDVIVLDVMMPQCDGLQACQQIRRTGCTTPVLLLTARDTLEDKVAGFNAGADDYLVKPFAMAELLCRLQALARRRSLQQAGQLTIAELVLDLSTCSARRAGQLLRLNPLQFKLLRLLLQAAPGIVSRSQLEAQLWPDQPPDSDALRSHLYQLRQVLDKPFAYPMLETVRGHGYRLRGGPHED